MPFTDGAGNIWTGVSRSAPIKPKKGSTLDQWKGNYSETVRIDRCVPGTQVELILNPFLLATLGEMKVIEHRAAVLARDANGNLLGSVVTELEKDKKVNIVDLDEEATVTVTLP